MFTTTSPAGCQADQALLAALLAGERFWPAEPQSPRETGLAEPFLESLICKSLLARGTATGRHLASQLCLPHAVLEPFLERLRTQQIVVLSGSGPLNDYAYRLTEQGHQRARAHRKECAYVGPAPVPLADYVISVEAQAISDEVILRSDLEDAFHDISVDSSLLELLGPAVNSASGLFLYGAPGNGKSTVAKRITDCFGQEIWLPHVFLDGQEIVKVYDPAFHEKVPSDHPVAGTPEQHDRRWCRVKRPTVVVGGELTMDSLEIRHDPVTNISEAPLQLKSNCGCLLIDDFGRQRISPGELLNRWIIPLENRHDFLTLGSGKKIQVPFEQLVIFSTNLDPVELVDEAFLRRIAYKIEVGDPSEAEFHRLFRLAAEETGCDPCPNAVDYLLEKHYRPNSRPLRRCHPRDLLRQLRHYCNFNEYPFELAPEYLDHIANSYFTAVRTLGANGVTSGP
ncbi:MAG: AAA family ATPase [Pirellulaceae bacterium]